MGKSAKAAAPEGCSAAPQAAEQMDFWLTNDCVPKGLVQQTPTTCDLSVTSSPLRTDKDEFGGGGLPQPR